MKVEMTTTDMRLIASLLHNEVTSLGGRPSTDHIARHQDKVLQNILAQLPATEEAFRCSCDYCREAR